MSCWLPERFDDLINRVDVLYRDERGKHASQDFIYIWEDNNNIVGVILPDGDSFNSSIRPGYEYIFSEMLDFAEDNSTAFIEPVCTREKYRKKGFAKQMLYGVINKLKEMKIEKCYINSYDWRKKVYNASGFETIDSIGFWNKEI